MRHQANHMQQHLARQQAQQAGRPLPLAVRLLLLPPPACRCLLGLLLLPAQSFRPLPPRPPSLPRRCASNSTRAACWKVAGKRSWSCGVQPTLQPASSTILGGRRHGQR